MSTHDMSDDEPVDVDVHVDATHVATLEQRLDGMESKANATHKLLQTLMESMGLTAPPVATNSYDKS